MILPFYWLIVSSLKVEAEMFTIPVKWFPASPVWGNYISAFTAAPFNLYYMNSFKICVIRIIGCLFFSSLAAYSFAKLKFRGKDKLFLLYLATLMLPAQVTIVPSFILMSKIGWIDSHLPLTVALFFLMSFSCLDNFSSPFPTLF